MSAPDFKTLYKFEDTFETGIKGVLVAAGIATVGMQRDVAEQVTPRVDLQFQTGSCREHYTPSAAHAGELLFDQWNATLETWITTDRTQNRSSHTDLVALVRATLYRFTNFGDSVFPYHEILRMMETGAAAMTEDGRDLDITKITWQIVFGIKPEAWP